MRLDIGTWLYGLVGDMVRGGATSVTAGVTVAAIDPGGDFTLGRARSFELMGAVFAVHAVLALMKYLQDNPLPKIIKTTTTEERSPHTSVVTTDSEDGKTVEERSPHSSVVTKVVEEIPVDPKSLATNPSPSADSK